MSLFFLQWRKFHTVSLCRVFAFTLTVRVRHFLIWIYRHQGLHLQWRHFHCDVLALTRPENRSFKLRTCKLTWKKKNTTNYIILNKSFADLYKSTSQSCQQKDCVHKIGSLEIKILNDHLPNTVAVNIYLL